MAQHTLEHEWTDDEGQELSHPEFIMRYVSPRVWEELGIYPLPEDHVEYGLFMREAELAPGKTFPIKVAVNRSENTASIEVINPRSDVLRYSSYLIPVDQLDQELIKLKDVLGQ